MIDSLGRAEDGEESEATTGELTAFIEKAKMGEITNQDIPKFAKMFKVCRGALFLVPEETAMDVSPPFVRVDRHLKRSFYALPTWRERNKLVLNQVSVGLGFPRPSTQVMHPTTDVAVGAGHMDFTVDLHAPVHTLVFVFRLLSGRTDDGQHLAVGSGEHVPIYGGAPVRERQLPAVSIAVEAAGHHAGVI